MGEANANTVTETNVSTKETDLPTKDTNVSTETYKDNKEEADYIDLEIIKITAGLTKKQEVTFDKVRNISGEAKEGTALLFMVYQDEEQEEIESYSQSVGASGLFTQLIELKEGKNYIKIFVEQNDQKQTFLFEIERKKEEIKKELENIKIDNIFSGNENPTQDTVLETLVK